MQIPFSAHLHTPRWYDKARCSDPASLAFLPAGHAVLFPPSSRSCASACEGACAPLFLLGGKECGRAALILSSLFSFYPKTETTYLIQLVRTISLGPLWVRGLLIILTGYLPEGACVCPPLWRYIPPTCATRSQSMGQRALQVL